MAGRNIKFSLNMENSTEVRSLEELRENTDVDFVLRLNISVDEIQKCMQSSVALPDTIIEKENMDIKEKLKSYTSASLDDYKISVVPEKNEAGETVKYSISVLCKSTEQYMHFILPYDINEDYTEELFEDDLCEKIDNTITALKEMNKYNTIKKSYYEKLEVGDIFRFGRFEGKAVLWKVIKKSDEVIYAVSNDILCESQFSVSNSNNWNSSDIRKWLNSEFYNNTFSSAEKEYIDNVCGDKISLLTKDEAEQLLDQKERALGKVWWLRSPYHFDSAFVWDVYADGDINYYFANYSWGVRPVFNLKLKKLK